MKVQLDKRGMGSFTQFFIHLFSFFFFFTKSKLNSNNIAQSNGLPSHELL